MAIVKSDPKGQYFTVGMDIAIDQNMNLAERGMMLTLLSLPPEWRYSNEGMVHILPDGKQKVCNVMKSLITIYLITINTLTIKKGFVS